MSLATCQHKQALTPSEIKAWIIELKRTREISSHLNEYSVVVSTMETASEDDSYYYELYPKFERVMDITLIK